ncbi:uncharacterized protein [Nicotiana sylvestris]|uniref:Uncharacterized protein n=1 Tax=Nicotiana tabacum TaxID=4097 RepID=A0A1S3Z2R9_TOBAC|nr:PREDICTED: uncharacterized protein LOC107782368 [Nicotiana tabacum]XP_016458733.1 PREDICTED: uncharacterized protein LOC107782368 [Nicotiana tabacum]XP_016458735.1 PREDICTED: uncharacterized protein LOC107782368 [Nicotiana tabacum]
MGFDEMEPIFGRVNAEWSAPHKTPLKPFLFHVHGLPSDPSTLRVCATDFHSNTWDSLKSAQELEGMRDRTGIGGSWSDFVDYLIASVKSEDVKLVMDGHSKLGGAAHAKLVAQKAKGMPRIAISLSKLVDTSATEAMANISLELYKTFTNVHNLLKTEQKQCSELTNVLSEEKQEKNETGQYSKRQKLQKITEKTASDIATVRISLESPDKQAAQPPSTKVTNRVVPAHRRARVRGVLLHDTEDETQD